MKGGKGKGRPPSDWDDIVKAVSLEMGIRKPLTKDIIKCLFDHMFQTLLDKQELSMYKFGIFRFLTKPPRQVHHPGTGERYIIPERKYIRFYPNVAIKGQIKTFNRNNPAYKVEENTENNDNDKKDNN